MKIRYVKREKLILIDFEKKAYTIQRHGHPSNTLWDCGFGCYLLASYMPFFRIIAYEKF